MKRQTNKKRTRRRLVPDKNSEMRPVTFRLQPKLRTKKKGR